MGKQPQKHAESEVAEEAKALDIYESDLVKLKKENAKQMEAALKKEKKKVVDSLDQKQVAAAAKALQNFYKKNKKTDRKNILDDENPCLHLSLTLSRVPSHVPTPRPLQVSLPNAFNKA
jgi:hypothetical protein